MFGNMHLVFTVKKDFTLQKNRLPQELMKVGVTFIGISIYLVTIVIPCIYLKVENTNFTITVGVPCVTSQSVAKIAICRLTLDFWKNFTLRIKPKVEAR